MGIANITNNILTDSGITVTSLPSGSGTTNEISYWVSASSIGGLTTATYPSLTELSYVKGVTSAIQTQFSGKQNLSTNLTSIDGLIFASTSFVKMTAAGTFSLDTNTYLTANQSITLSGDISGTGSTAITTAIGANKVTNAMLAQVATASFLGRATAATGDVETLTGTQATTLLDVFTSSLKGLAPASGGGTTNFLRADGTWAAPAGGGGGMAIGGSITSATAGSVLFAGTGGVLQQDNANFFWDDTNNRLGVGTNAPATNLTIQQGNQVYSPLDLTNFEIAFGISSNSALISGMDFKNFNTGGQVRFMSRNDVNDYVALNSFGSSASGTFFGINRNNTHVLFGQGVADSTKKLSIGTFNAGDLIFGTNNLERLRILGNNGNLLLNTTTDAGFRLDVNGTGRYTGALTVTAANSTTDGGGQIYLNGATGNRIDFNTNGNGAPTFTTRSAGTKIVLYPGPVTASTVDLALGIESGAMWFSVVNSSNSFKWYAGITNIMSLSGTGVLTLTAGIVYKRLNPTTTTLTSTATLTPDISVGDFFTITAQAVGLSVSNPTGTPVGGQKMTIRIKDNGTAQAITWSGTQFRASTDLTLPTSTTATKTIYLGFLYNSTDTKWDLVSKINNF